MRLSAEDDAEIRKQADLAGMSVSEFVRRRALRRPVKAAVDLMMIRELRRTGGLQKHTISKSLQHPEVVEECITTIKAVRAAVERVANHDRETN